MAPEPAKKTNVPKGCAIAVIAFVVLAGLGALLSATDPDSASEDEPLASAIAEVLEDDPTPEPEPTATPLPDGAFGDGTWRVGSDIKPGTYRTQNESGSCYWARLRGLSGEFNDIITNENPDGPSIVTIPASDAGFTSSDCDLWVPVS